MKVDGSAARALLGLIDADVPESDVPILLEMLQAHFTAFESVEALELQEVEPAATFQASWDD